jgi:DNA polymerase-3 subunit gamma/tau
VSSAAASEPPSDDVSAQTPSTAAAPAGSAGTEPEPAPGPRDDATGVDLVTVRRMWPDVLEAVKGMRRFTWTLLSHNAQVAGLEGGRLTLAMVNAGARDSFLRGGSDEIVREALIKVLGVDWKVDAIVDPSTDPGSALAGSPPSGGGGAATPPAAAPAPSGRAAAMAAVAQEAAATAEEPSGVEDAPSADDDDADDSGLTSQDLLARELGAKVIGEYDAS